jgi:hypothetical protein
MSREIIDAEDKVDKGMDYVIVDMKHEERIAELEIKMAKLWDLLTQKTPVSKQTKTSPFANRVFRGRV